MYMQLSIMIGKFKDKRDILLISSKCKAILENYEDKRRI